MRKKMHFAAALMLSSGLTAMLPDDVHAANLSPASISLSERILFADLAAEKAVGGGHPVAIARTRLNGIDVWRVSIDRKGQYWWVFVDTHSYRVLKTVRI